MRVEHLSLTNFRNYAHLELSVPDATIVLHGQNAQGKTSLLEAFYFVATARSPYATMDRQLVHWRAVDDPLPHARIVADISTKDNPFTRIEMTLMLDGNRSKKVIRVNGNDQRVMDMVGLLNVVLFVPQDLMLVEGSPSDRRRFMDSTLSQVDADYLGALNTYEKVLPQRNALLRNIAAGHGTPQELAFWDEQVIESGAVIIAGRQRFLRELEFEAQTVHGDLTGNQEVLTLQYQPSFSPRAAEGGQMSFETLGLDLHREMTADQIAPQFADQLKAEQSESILRGVTLSGPHRDELRMSINGHDVGFYGSRGQARTTVMALKLAELAWMTRHIGEYPLLLLDEVIAELDASRRAFLLERLDGQTQTLMTTTEPDIFTSAFLERSVIWRVEAGQIDTA